MASILIIDTQQDFLERVTLTLHQENPNHTLLTARSGSEGIIIAKEQQPDLILLDVAMPDLSGFEVCETLKADPDTTLIPIVFLTGINISTEEKIRGLNLGADAYLTKPIDEAELLAQVRTLLRLQAAENALRKGQKLLDERVKARTRELEEIQNQWSATFEAMSDWVAIIDIKTQVVLRSNSAVKTLFGVNPSSVEGQSCCNIVHNTKKQVSNCPLLKMIETGKPCSSTFQHSMTGRWFQVTVDPIKPKTGKAKTAVHIVRDISDRKETEESLRESEEKFRTMTEATATAIFIIQGEQFVYVNPAFKTITGYSLSALKGMAFYDIVHPDYRELVKERGKARQRGEKIPAHYTFKICTRSGETRWVDFFASYLQYQGQPALIGSAFDITEQKDAEAKIKRVNQQLQKQVDLNTQMLATTMDGFILADVSGWILDVNPAYCQMSGYSREDLLTMNIVQLEANPVLNKIVDQIQAIATTGSLQLETRHRAKNGHILDLEISISIIPAPEGSLITAFLRDITDRKKAQKKIESINRRLKDMVNRLNLIYQSSRKMFTGTIQNLAETVIDLLEQIALYDFGSILLVNSERTQLYPLTVARRGMDDKGIAEDMDHLSSLNLTLDKGITGWVATHGKSVRCHDVSQDKRYFAAREGIRSELCVPIKTESEVIGVLNVEARRKRAFTPNDQSVLETLAAHLAVAIQNRRYLDKLHEMNEYLEERVRARTKELERNTRDLEQSQEALVTLIKNLNRTQSRLEAFNKRLRTAYDDMESFSYSVSHDLRAPLRAITGFAHILEEDYSSVLDEEGQRLLNVVQENAAKMSELIDDLLTLSRLGRKHLEIDDVDMNALVRECKAEVLRDYPTARIHWRIHRLPRVKGDVKLLKQLWLNLLSNAVKFTSKVDHPWITVNVREYEDRYEFWVRDNGAGFNPRYQNKLFQVFQRLHPETEFSGTGIGLSLVKQIITRHGGDVWAKGQVGKGATFYFSLLKSAPPQLDEVDDI